MLQRNQWALLPPPYIEPVMQESPGFDAEPGYSVTGDFEDGGAITVSSVSGGFGSNALKYAAMGFGSGWLYEQTVGTGIAVSIPSVVTSESFLYEFSASTRRRVADVDGVRALYADQSYTASTSFAGGCINWDTGSNFAEGEGAFLSSVVRIRSATQNESGGSTQWKSYRLRHSKNLDGDSDNTAYHKKFLYNATTSRDNQLAGELTKYAITSASTDYGHAHPNFNDKWTRHDLYMNCGNVDTVNGVVASSGLLWGESAWVGKTNSAIQFIYSGSANRWRWLMLEDFVNFSTGVELWVTDLFYQRGTRARFELTDSATYSASTTSVVQLPTAWDDTAVSLMPWRGLNTTYSGLHLHFIADSGATTYIGQVP